MDHSMPGRIAFGHAAINSSPPTFLEPVLRRKVDDHSPQPLIPLSADRLALNGVARLEMAPVEDYILSVDAPEHSAEVPAGWLEALAESDAELAAGQSVSGEVVRQRLLDSIARIEARKTTARQRGTASRR